MVIGGTGCILTSMAKNLWQIAVTSGIFSVASAGYYALLNVVLVQKFGKNSIGSTYGFARMVQGAFNFVFPPLLGIHILLPYLYYLN